MQSVHPNKLIWKQDFASSSGSNSVGSIFVGPNQTEISSIRFNVLSGLRYFSNNLVVDCKLPLWSLGFISSSRKDGTGAMNNGIYIVFVLQSARSKEIPVDADPNQS
mmetsp:Transcript_18808/g.24222  ORF Transcript_18808/g.24222 Transcript_18808/m.24222 type:complete len:107 (-) Transcript_18808:83-403(-)